MRSLWKDLLQPNPHPLHERDRIFLGEESIVRELEPPLSDIARCLDGVAQIIRSFWTPILYLEAMLSDLIA